MEFGRIHLKEKNCEVMRFKNIYIFIYKFSLLFQMDALELPWHSVPGNTHLSQALVFFSNLSVIAELLFDLKEVCAYSLL